MPESNAAFIDPRRLDWNLLRAFVLVADLGSLSRAAGVLGASQPTLSRQVAALEEEVGAALFERVARGLRLTEAGAALLDPARRMMAAAQALSLAAGGQSKALTGTVRLTASEVVSAFVLPDILARLAQVHPDIEVELVATNRVDNLLEREADVAIRMVQPEQSALITRRLADWPLGFYARRDYLARVADKTGAPVRIDRLGDYRWVGFDQSDQMIEGFRMMGQAVDRHFFAFRCDNQIVDLQAVRAGLGIGVVIQHLAAGFPELEPVLPELPLPVLPIWLTAHRELRSVPRIRLVFDFLAEALAALR